VYNIEAMLIKGDCHNRASSELPDGVFFFFREIWNSSCRSRLDSSVHPERGLCHAATALQYTLHAARNFNRCAQKYTEQATV
jgi:hypothetical protein